MGWGEFQGKEASEQRIRELCGGMISGEWLLPSSSCPPSGGQVGSMPTP